MLRMMKAIDPTFDREQFERELREYIVPEVVDAYLSADQKALKDWCSEATYNVLWATMEHYLKQGLVSESKVLDIRQVDVSSPISLPRMSANVVHRSPMARYWTTTSPYTWFSLPPRRSCSSATSRRARSPSVPRTRSSSACMLRLSLEYRRSWTTNSLVAGRLSR